MRSETHYARIADGPHYRVQAQTLAAWIEQQGTSTLWRVDGDPVLMSNLEFPCPCDELAGELRRINTALLVADPNHMGAGQEVVTAQLSNLVESEELGVPTLYLSWQDGLTDWLLIKDEPVTEPSRDAI
jgi:hypothetical protein